MAGFVAPWAAILTARGICTQIGFPSTTLWTLNLLDDSGSAMKILRLFRRMLSIAVQTRWCARYYYSLRTGGTGKAWRSTNYPSRVYHVGLLIRIIRPGYPIFNNRLILNSGLSASMLTLTNQTCHLARFTQLLYNCNDSTPLSSLSHSDYSERKDDDDVTSSVQVGNFMVVVCDLVRLDYSDDSNGTFDLQF